MTVPPEPVEGEPEERLPGRWLFGGMLYGHFGHFLCESTARLWALDLRDDYDGILYFPKPQLTWERRLTRGSRGFFECIGAGHLDIRAPQRPVRVESLDCPEQGFGVSEMTAGRPEYRAFMRARLTAATPASGPERLYISRSRLNAKRGVSLHEEDLANHLEKHGYEVFHPQEHPLAEQIARYRAARAIVALDGSALHLAAMVVEPDCKVAILNRAPSTNINDYVRQFRAFARIDPLCIEAVDGFFSIAGRRIIKREVYSTFDFPTISRALTQHGFLAQDADWDAVDPAVAEARRRDLEGRLGAPLDYHTTRRAVS